MSDSNPVMVVGGGLGGLSCALALAQQGRRVKLLEQSAEIAPIGYGVQIGPNVLPVLDAMGLGAAVREAAYLPDHLHLHDAGTGRRFSASTSRARSSTGISAIPTSRFIAWTCMKFS